MWTALVIGVVLVVVLSSCAGEPYDGDVATMVTTPSDWERNRSENLGKLTPTPFPTPGHAKMTSTRPAPSKPTSIPINASCEKAWRDAASIDDMSDTVEDLDPAVFACRSLDEWNAVEANYPAALDGVDSVLFLSNRCYYGPKSATLCKWLKANPSFIHSDSNWGLEVRYGDLLK